MDNNKPETIFAEGLYLNRVSPNAPAFIITNQSIHIEKAIAWLISVKHLADNGGYIRLVGKESKNLDDKGLPKRYLQLDTWKPSVAEVMPSSADDIDPDDIPFN